MRRKAFLSSFAALLALGWSGLAQAEEPVQMPTVDAVDFANVTNVQLDVAFERMLSKRHKQPSALRDPSGPTNMACHHGTASSELETCTVTTPSESPAPASPDQP